MPTSDPRVDTYIANAQPFARPILTHLRKLIHQSVPNLEESIRWQLPTFLLAGQQLCNIGSFTAHCSLVIAPRSMGPILQADGFDAQQSGMGQFGKITSVKELPAAPKLKSYFKLAAQHLKAPPTAKLPAPARKPTIPTPPELTAALKLKSHALAAATWQAFTPPKRRDYSEWISEAKRPDTRARRLATTLEWLAEGKPRHWKYQDC